MTQSRWQKIGPWRYPFQYWTDELLKYFYHFEFDELIRMKPRVTQILQDSVDYCYSGDNEVHSIFKEELKDYWIIEVDERFKYGKPMGAILDISDSPILHSYNVAFDINGKERTGQVSVDIISEDIFYDVFDKIQDDNPHWEMSILTDSQLENNIYDVLNSNFERFFFTTYSNC